MTTESAGTTAPTFDDAASDGARSAGPGGPGTFDAVIPNSLLAALWVVALLPLVPVPTAAQEAGPSMSVPAHPEPAWYLEAAGADCELFVQEYGRGPDTLVVLHGGWGAEHGYLLDAFAGLGERHHLVFYDQRGSLRSPCPDSAITVDAHVADLERLRNELALERLHLVAHSMGTRLALEYLASHPDRVGGMVLMGAVDPRPFDPATDSAIAARHGKRRTAFFEREACDDEIREEGLARPDSLLSDEEVSARWRIRFACANMVHVERWRQMKGGQVFYAASAGRAAAGSMADDFDATDDLAAHGCPVRVIVGARDFVVGGEEVTRHMYGGLPSVTVTILDDAAHQLWLDRPDVFPEVLFDAVAEATACPPPGGRP